MYLNDNFIWILVQILYINVSFWRQNWLAFIVIRNAIGVLYGWHSTNVYNFLELIIVFIYNNTENQTYV